MSNIASNIIDKFGGPQRLSALLGVDVSWVYRWTYPKNRGGTDGEIPRQHQKPILKLAKKHNVDVQAEDFFGGRA